MNGTFDHERALLLILKPGVRPADAFEALLAHPDVRSWYLPPPWAFEDVEVDLLDAMPGLGTITRENLPEVLDVLARLHTPQKLDALCRRLWRDTTEQVRSFFLKRPVGATFASIFRLGPRSVELPPPKDFVHGQVVLHRFEMQYRLRRGEETTDPAAPPEEGSLVLYPFDLPNEAAREEASLTDLPPTVPILEAFAYAAGRERHRQVLEEVAWKRGWRVVDSAASG